MPSCWKRNLSDGFPALRRTFTETLIGFLLGAAWALALVGAALFFWSFFPFGLLIAVMAAFVGSLFGLLCVVLLEVASLQFERKREMRHQTELLQKITESLRQFEGREAVTRPTAPSGEDDASLRDH